MTMLGGARAHHAALALLLGCSSAAATLPPVPPSFSWDTLPVFMHSGNSSGPLSNATAAFMGRFPLVTMAGFNGGHNGGNEKSFTPFAAAVKAQASARSDSAADGNASVRVLFYQNTLINFPQTRLGNLQNSTLPEALLLHDKRGRLVYMGGCGAHHAAPNHTLYDHRQPAMRAAWTQNIVDVAKDPANKGLMDGVFCDRSGSIGAVTAKDLHCYDLAPGFVKGWDRGHWQAIADTQAALSALLPTAIVIGNHAEPTASMRLPLPGNTSASWNAKMYEHFTPTKTNDQYIPNGNQLAAFKHDGRSELIAEVHVDSCQVARAGNGGGNQMYKASLAAFLIGASRYDYYACTTGWGFTDGWQHWSPDYDRPLGEPLGPANKTATGWRRQFSSGTEVWLETRDEAANKWGSSCIRWADGHVTASGHLCTHG